MSAATGDPGHAVGLIDGAREVLRDVDRGLATVERDIVVVERVGTLVLVAGAVLGGLVLVGVALAVIRRRSPVAVPATGGPPGPAGPAPADASDPAAPSPGP